MGSSNCGLGGAPDIDSFVLMQINNLSKETQTFSSIFRFVFLLEDNIMAESGDGNIIHTTTYGQCKKAIFRIAAVISSRLKDVPKGSVIGVHMDNSIEWIQIFWSLLMCGYVPLLMNNRLGKERLVRALNENGIQAVISDDEIFPVLTLDCLELCHTETAEALSPHAQWADEVIFMTSGTSGKVKLCGYTGERICRQIYNTKRIIKESKEIKTHVDGSIKQLTFLPFYHVFGFLACYMWFAFFARTFVFLRNYNSDTILETIRRHKVTHIFAVPMLWNKIESAALKAIADRGEAVFARFQKGMAISHKLQRAGFGKGFAKKAFKEVRDNIFGDSVQFMISGGGSISDKTLSFFNGIGYHLVNGYGMTEVGIASVQLGRKYQSRCTAAVGAPFESVEYSIIEGELAVRSGSMASYIISDGKKHIIDNRNWFLTEDSGECRNGQWYVKGRRDDIIVTSSGENIEPSFVEDKLCIKGAECLLLGVSDSEGNVKAVLTVSVEKGYDASLVYKKVKEELERLCLTSYVDDIRITFEPFIKGSEFKLNRRRIRQDIAQGKMEFEDVSSEPLSCTESTDRLKEEIAALFEKALGCSISPSQYGDNFFYDLHGTSLCYFELTENIKIKLGIDILSIEGKSFYSINDVYEHAVSLRVKI